MVLRDRMAVDKAYKKGFTSVEPDEDWREDLKGEDFFFQKRTSRQSQQVLLVVHLHSTVASHMVDELFQWKPSMNHIILCCAGHQCHSVILCGAFQQGPIYLSDS